MAVYTVHEPPMKRSAERRGPDRFAFVRDGFFFWAFLFGPLWMLWNRLWLALIGFVVVAAILLVGLRLIGASGDASFWAYTLLSFLVGLEAGTLRRWTLRRGGWRDAGLVSAHDLEAAEQRFFGTWSAEEAPTLPILRGSASQTMGRAAPPDSDIIGGMFPQPGQTR